MNLQKHFQKTEFTFLFTITIRGLLDDTYFIQAVKKVVQEPIPYFRQFSDKLPTHGAINSPPISSTPRQPSDAAPDQVGGNILGIISRSLSTFFCDFPFFLFLYSVAPCMNLITYTKIKLQKNNTSNYKLPIAEPADGIFNL